MTRPTVIAIDGPSGAGKSTVGELLARRLGYFYFDTGILYRALALQALESGVDASNEGALAEVANALRVDVLPPSVEGRQYDVLLDGRDVTDALRRPDVDRVVSRFAASAAVRRALVDQQRRQVRGDGSVLAGRDIGTVICPDADVKIFLEASLDERARRRLGQLGQPDDRLSSIMAAIAERDHIDATRALAPLTVAPDAHVIRTDGVRPEEVVEQIVSLLDRTLARSASSPNH